MRRTKCCRKMNKHIQLKKKKKKEGCGPYDRQPCKNLHTAISVNSVDTQILLAEFLTVVNLVVIAVVVVVVVVVVLTSPFFSPASPPYPLPPPPALH